MLTSCIKFPYCALSLNPIRSDLLYFDFHFSQDMFKIHFWFPVWLSHCWREFSLVSMGLWIYQSTSCSWLFHISLHPVQEDNAKHWSVSLKSTGKMILENDQKIPEESGFSAHIGNLKLSPNSSVPSMGQVNMPIRVINGKEAKAELPASFYLGCSHFRVALLVQIMWPRKSLTGIP